jgi:imidazolonepropionase-like amidohydrolase
MKRIVLMLLLALPLGAQSVIPNNPGTKGSVVIRNATIYPVSGSPIANGSIAFANGVITAVGASVEVPANATVIDGSGLSVYPGLIDAGSTVGLTEIESVAGTVDTTEIGDINPNARADVAVNPHSNVIPVTRVNGVTTVLTVPEGGIISGQSALIQLAGWTPPEMTLKAPVGMHIRFPRLRSAPAFGAAPVEPDEEAEREQRRNYTKQLDRLRDTFRDAQAYAKAASARGPRFDRDLVLEALVPVVEGRVPVMIEANLARDIREALKFVDELKLKAVLVGAQDVRPVIPELKKRNIPVILGPILALPPREDDPYDLLFANAAALHEAGVRFAIRTNDAHNSRNLPYHAAACAAFGLPREEALKAITIYPAEIFGVADRLGSLAPGKIANVIVTDGDPLEIRTNVKRVFIGGEEIPMDSYHTLLYEKFRKRP